MLITRRQWLTLTLSAIPCHAFAGRDVDDEICTLARLAPLSLQFHGTTASQCRAWQQMFSTKLKQLLGTYEPPAQWETIRERTVNLEDHRRDELVLRASGHRDLPVYLLSP